MKQNMFLGIDIGTTLSKGTIINNKGEILSEKLIQHSSISPKQGWHEHNPEEHWWSEFLELVSQMQNDIQSLHRIEGICISGMWPTFCLTDSTGAPLYNAILYDDIRSESIIRTMGSDLGTDIDGYEFVPRMLWFQRHYPKLWEKGRKVFTTHSYIVYKLTGEYCIDSQTAFASGKSFFDEQKLQWKEALLREHDIDVNLLPPVYPSSRIAGYITDKVAAITGLKSGTPVAVGIGDSFASILGSGACQPGDGMMYYGSLGMLVQLTRPIEYILSASSFEKKIDGIHWLLSLPNSGKQLEWLADILAGKLDEKINALSYLDEGASHVGPGAGGITFIFNTRDSEYMDLKVAVLPRSTITGLTTNSTNIEIYRAALEAFGYESRRALTSSIGGEIIRLFATGGGAKSNVWRQITSDILMKEQIFNPKALGAFGTSILAGYSVGAFSASSIPSHNMNNVNITYPQPNLSEVYEKHYHRYLRIARFLS